MSIVNALTTSVSGMSAQSNALSTIGDNIANSSTVGYKNASAQFESLLAQMPNATLSSGAVQTDARYSVTNQGAVTTTNSSTDLAISGNGMFVVSDNAQGTYYTRAGSFLPNASGTLVNSAGFQLMGYASGPGGTSSSLTPVTLPTNGKLDHVTVGSDGTLTEFFTDGSQSSTYKIPLATFQSANNLTPLGGNVFGANANAGALTISAPGTLNAGSVKSGALEQSTVDLGSELTNMISTQRAYEANSKVLQASSDLYGMLKSMSVS